MLCTPNHDDIRGICLSPLDWQLAGRYLVVWAKIRAEAHRQIDKRTEEQAGRQADADRQMREERTGRQGERRQGRAELFLAEATVEIFSGLQVGSDETDDEPDVLCTENHDDIRGICLSPLDWQLAERCLVVWAKIRAEAHRQTDKRTEEQAGRQADADR